MKTITSSTVTKIDLGNVRRVRFLTRYKPREILSVNFDKRSIFIAIENDAEEISFTKTGFNLAIKEMKKVIEKRKDPGDRVEIWECTNFEGFYDFDIEKKLLKSRGYHPDASAMGFFCDMFNVPRSMGSMFIEELKVSKIKDDETAIKCAKILGLMK